MISLCNDQMLLLHRAFDFLPTRCLTRFSHHLRRLRLGCPIPSDVARKPRLKPLCAAGRER